MRSSFHRIRTGTLVAALTIAFVVAAGLPAPAVHEIGVMEVQDGDIVDSATGDPRDWTAFYGYNAGTGQYTVTPANFPAGTGDDSGVVRDFVPGSNSDPTYHEPSNKDDQPIDESGTSGVWGCVGVSNATDKTDILNVYAIAVTKTITGAVKQLIYFGVERYDNSGDAFLGLWFFQDEVGCNQATGKFTGSKQTNDILLLVNFTGGGATANVTALRYTEHPSSPDSQPGTLTQVGTTSLSCSAQGGGHSFCAETNDTNTFTTPWPHPDKDKPDIKGQDPDDQVDPVQFFEGGINLTDTFNLSSPICISSFMAETRSSSSVDASLKDFALGDLNTCGTVNVSKYHDKNADGSRDANGADNVLGGTGAADDEVPLNGWVIFIDANGNGILDSGEISRTTGPGNDAPTAEDTDPAGLVTFGNLQAGTYTICETLQTGWLNSDPGTATVVTGKQCESVTVGSETTASREFGNYQLATKTGVKFHDLDGGADKDTGEPGLNGWKILVFKDDGDGTLEDSDDGSGSDGFVPLNTQTTATVSSVLGTYSFSLQPGTYIVCEESRSDWTQNYPTSSTTSSADCGTGTSTTTSVTLARWGWKVSVLSGETDSGNHFGNAQLHRVIVLVCHQTDNSLVAASVRIDDDNATAKTSIHDVPSGALTTKGVTEAELCGIGGASFGDLTHRSVDADVTIPSTGTNSGHS